MSLIIQSLLNSKWGFFPWSLTFFKASAIRLDELDVIGDHLDGAALDPLICFPLGMIEDSGNSDLGALVKVFLADLGEAVETGHLYPAGFLFPCPESEIKACDGLPFRIEMYIRVISKVSC